jgi:hypothetical protein
VVETDEPNNDGVVADPADLIAEIDDEPDDDYDDTDGTDSPDMYTGTARGGPWDGRQAQSRYPRGFLLVDRDKRRVWLYDRQDDDTFQVRDDAGTELDDAGRWRAAEEPDYDLLTPDAELDDGVPS